MTINTTLEKYTCFIVALTSIFAASLTIWILMHPFGGGVHLNEDHSFDCAYVYFGESGLSTTDNVDDCRLKMLESRRDGDGI